NQCIGIFSRQCKKQFRQFPIRTNRTENFCVLHLPGHHGLVDAFLVQQVNRLAQFPEAYPMQSIHSSFEVWIGFFLDRNHRHFDSLAPRSFQNKKRKSSVAGDQPPSRCVGRVHSYEFSRSIYFTMPRSAVSMNWTSSITSAESEN